jgi:hypothetical protein
MHPSTTGDDPARPRPDAAPGAAETLPPSPAPDDESLVGDLLFRWRELRAQGRDVAAEDWCGDRPDLVERLRHDLRAVPAMEAFLDTGNRETLPPPAPPAAGGATPPPRPEGSPSDAAAPSRRPACRPAWDRAVTKGKMRRQLF